MKNFYENYRDKLGNIPPPGLGCHPYLMVVAHAGFQTGISSDQIFNDIKYAIPHGKRFIRDKEIWDAIHKASKTKFDKNRPFEPIAKPQKIIPEYLKKLIERGAGVSENDIIVRSPIAIPPNVASHAILLLDALYDNSDVIFIGTQYDKFPKTASQWKEKFEHSNLDNFPHIMPNPLSGKSEMTQDGRPSFRCDACVSKFVYAIVEFDNISREDQLAFWTTIPLPIAALIDSGGKSIHGWIKVSAVKSLEQWNDLIKLKLYKARLVPLGVDSACSNASRLSRLPGHFRYEKGNFQRLIYLNPDGTSPILRRSSGGGSASSAPPPAKGRIS